MFWFAWWRTKPELARPWDINWMRIYFTKCEMTHVILPVRNNNLMFLIAKIFIIVEKVKLEEELEERW